MQQNHGDISNIDAAVSPRKMCLYSYLFNCQECKCKVGGNRALSFVNLRHYLEKNDKLHAQSAVSQRKEPEMHIGQIGRWVGFRSGLDAVAEKKISVLVEKETSILLTSSPQRNRCAVVHSCFRSLSLVERSTAKACIEGTFKQLSEKNNANNERGVINFVRAILTLTICAFRCYNQDTTIKEMAVICMSWKRE